MSCNKIKWLKYRKRGRDIAVLCVFCDLWLFAFQWSAQGMIHPRTAVHLQDVFWTSKKSLWIITPTSMAMLKYIAQVLSWWWHHLKRRMIRSFLWMNVFTVNTMHLRLRRTYWSLLSHHHNAIVVPAKAIIFTSEKIYPLCYCGARVVCHTSNGIPKPVSLLHLIIY